MIRVWSSFIIGVLLFIGMAGSAFAQVPAAYDIEDLGTLGGSTLVGTAINARGDVAGNAELPDGTYHAFRWTREGGLEDLGANGGWYAEVFGINDNGDVVGMYLDEYFNQHGFVAPRGGVMRDLFTEEQAILSATSITNDGRLAGSVASFATFARSHGFRTLADGSLQDLGTGDQTSEAADMNEAGAVTGLEWHSTSPSDPITAFRYSDADGKVDLGTLGGLHSGGRAINSTDVVVGWAYAADNVGRAPRMWTSWPPCREPGSEPEPRQPGILRQCRR